MPASHVDRLRAAFDLADLDEGSLTPWASVHRGHTADGRDVVVKRTAGTIARADAMAAWTDAMRSAGIPVVTPVDLACANPQPVAGLDDEAGCWVVYPFIPGRPYGGSTHDVATAGDLLGRIHALNVRPDVLHALRPYRWPDTDRSDVDADVTTLQAVLERHVHHDHRKAVENITTLAERWWSRSFPTLRDADREDPLPRAAVTSDFKANNLVWAATDDRPVLVDPDNGGLEPRILDLALAVVLFHNECPTAPARLLSAEEWRVLVDAYLEHVQLTDRERELWPAALDHMLWEEGTWALEDNDDDAWADPRQGGQLVDLALASPERYPLP